MGVEYLVAVVDANGVRSNRVDPNMEVLDEDGFIVLNKTKLLIGEEHASALTSADNTDQRDFVSGPVVAVLLRRDDAYRGFMELKPDLDDMYGSCDMWSALRDKTIFFPTVPTLERTVVIIKPDQNESLIENVLRTLELNEFVIIGKKKLTLGAEECRKVFGNSADDIDYMTSGPSTILVVEKEGALDEWNLLMGPADPELARKIAPRSLRGVVGQNRVQNCVYGSESQEKAARDILLLFSEPFAIGRTLAIIKPDIIRNGYLPKIMAALADNGFTIMATETLHLSVERAEQLFERDRENPNYNAMLRYMSSGPSMALVVGKPGAVQAWKLLCGPESVTEARNSRPFSLRARYATDDVMNGFHGSASVEAANVEINTFFPQLTVDKVPSLLEVEDLLNRKPAPRMYVEERKSLNDVLVEGLAQLCRVKPLGLDAITWLGEWMLRNNPNKPAVELPSDADDVNANATIRQALEAKGVAETKLIWAVGSPGSGREEQCAYLVKNFGYEFIDTPNLIASFAKSGNEYGELIRKCQEAGKPVPAHVTAALIKNAITETSADGRTNKFLIGSFPANLDEAFEFERRVGTVDLMLYFDCTEQTRNQRVMKGATNEDIAKSMSQIKMFKDNVFPVIHHFSSFKKVAKISTDGSRSQIQSRLRRLF